MNQLIILSLRIGFHQLPNQKRELYRVISPAFITGSLTYGKRKITTCPDECFSFFFYYLLHEQCLLALVMFLKAAVGCAFVSILPIIPTLVFRNRCRWQYLKAFQDAGLLQTSTLDGMDPFASTSWKKRTLVVISQHNDEKIIMISCQYRCKLRNIRLLILVTFYTKKNNNHKYNKTYLSLFFPTSSA